MNTNYAGFWMRFLALIIDGIIIGIVRWIVILPILAAMGIGMASANRIQSLANSWMIPPRCASNNRNYFSLCWHIAMFVSTIIWIALLFFDGGLEVSGNDR